MCGLVVFVLKKLCIAVSAKLFCLGHSHHFTVDTFKPDIRQNEGCTIYFCLAV